MSKALDVTLPKWPAMTVMGKRVTSEQAAEILIRTNRWHSGCNDREWESVVQKAIGVDLTHASKYSAEFEAIEKASVRLRRIPLSYLHNARIMSSWIGGPHGWCNWNGDIHATNYNIGKWPIVDEVRSDWAEIAEEFPFLDLRCQLWQGETSEANNRPLVEYIVKGGKVRTILPKKPLLYPVFGGSFEPFCVSNERGCSEETLRRAIQITLDASPRPSDWDRLGSL